MIGLSDNIIIRPIENNLTSTGIIIPDGSNFRHPRGEIVGAGPGPADDEVTVKEGDVVIYINEGFSFEHEGETLVKISWKNVIAKI